MENLNAPDGKKYFYFIDREHVVRKRSKEILCCCCSCYFGFRTFIKISSKLDHVKTCKNYAEWIVYSWLFLNTLIFFSLYLKINWLDRFYFPTFRTEFTFSLVNEGIDKIFYCLFDQEKI